jgi:hypothetical protein
MDDNSHENVLAREVKKLNFLVRYDLLTVIIEINLIFQTEKHFFLNRSQFIAYVNKNQETFFNMVSRISIKKNIDYFNWITNFCTL